MFPRNLLHTMPRGFQHSAFCVCKAIRQTEVWSSPLLCKDCADYVKKNKKGVGRCIYPYGALD